MSSNVKEDLGLLPTPHQQRRDPEWKLCCSNSDSMALKYLVQVIMAATVMIFSMFCIVTSNTDDDKSIFWSLLSSTLTYFLDSPTPRPVESVPTVS